MTIGSTTSTLNKNNNYVGRNKESETLLHEKLRLRNLITIKLMYYGNLQKSIITWYDSRNKIDTETFQNQGDKIRKKIMKAENSISKDLDKMDDIIYELRNNFNVCDTSDY